MKPVRHITKHQEAMKEAERKMIEALVEFARQAGNK